MTTQQGVGGNKQGCVSAMSAKEAIAALNGWGSRGFFNSRRIGDRIQICECVGHPCQVVSLQTHYERRFEKTITEPYRGGPVDNIGQPPGVWDIKVAKPQAFVEGLYEQVIPHTDRVDKCSVCGGSGQVPCGSCFGRGEVLCGSCSGTGFRTEIRLISRDEWFNGQWERRLCSESVRVPCGCGTGYRSCFNCGGSGNVKCSECSGYGQLKSYQFLTVSFAVEEGKSVAVAPDDVKEKVRQVTGVVTYQREEELITVVVDIGPELHAHAVSLLKKAQVAGGKVLRQRLKAEVIPVTEAIYKRHARGPKKSLWIYGNEKEVYGSRWLLTNWWAVIGVAAGAVGSVAALVMWVLQDFPMRQEPEPLVKQSPLPSPVLFTPLPATKAPAIKASTQPSPPAPKRNSSQSEGERPLATSSRSKPSPSAKGQGNGWNDSAQYDDESRWQDSYEDELQRQYSDSEAALEEAEPAPSAEEQPEPEPSSSAEVTPSPEQSPEPIAPAPSEPPLEPQPEPIAPASPPPPAD